MALKGIFCVGKTDIKVKIFGQQLRVQVHNIKNPHRG